jgi:type II secretory pathway pseudopilin PulG
MTAARFRTNEKGSALVYILIAIALLAALTITFMEPSSQQTSTQNTFKTLTEVESQANVIRAAVQECVLSYPKGDQLIDNSISGTDPGARKNYPIDPDSNYYSTATPPSSGDHLVRSIRCPGNNPGGVNVKDHELIFSGSEGKFLPPPPDLFADWQYYNGDDGVFFWIDTDKSDAFLLTALSKLDEKFAECEADIVDTSDSPAGAKDLDSSGTYECAAGHVCFRVWMLMNKTSAVFNGDVDSDEATCAP